jgi:hypothetical protein
MKLSGRKESVEIDRTSGRSLGTACPRLYVVVVGERINTSVPGETRKELLLNRTTGNGGNVAETKFLRLIVGQLQFSSEIHLVPRRF